jgi:hypothetical protein
MRRCGSELTGEVTGEEEENEGSMVCVLVFRIPAVGLPSAPFVMGSGLGSGVDGAMGMVGLGGLKTRGLRIGVSVVGLWLFR